MKTKPTRPPRPKDPHARVTHVTIRVNTSDLKKIRAQAKRYTEGNVSEMLRFGAIHYKKQVEDFE